MKLRVFMPSGHAFIELLNGIQSLGLRTNIPAAYFDYYGIFDRFLAQVR